MRDEYESRLWAQHHQEVTAFIASLFDKGRYAFERLQAYQYEAPWQRKSNSRCEE